MSNQYITPIKDKIKVSDIIEAENKIKSLLCSFIKNNDYSLVWGRYNNTINMVTGPVQQSPYTEKIADPIGFIKNTFSIFTEPEKTPSHKIHTANRKEFYEEIYSNLTPKEKMIFIKSISDHSTNHLTVGYIAHELDDAELYRHLRFIAPFGKGSKQGWVFKKIQNALNSKTVNTDEKAQAVIQFYHYFKSIIRRTDTINSIIRYVNKNVDEKYHESFEKIIGTSLKKDIVDENFFSLDNNLVVVKIDKSKIFENLPLAHFPQAEVGTYNNLIYTIVNSLNTNLKDKVGVEHIFVEELCSQNKPARLYIEASEGGFKCNINELLNELFIVSSTQFKPNNRNEMSKIHEDTFNYYMIKNSIGNKENLESESKSNKRLKI